MTHDPLCELVLKPNTGLRRGWMCDCRRFPEVRADEEREQREHLLSHRDEWVADGKLLGVLDCIALLEGFHQPDRAGEEARSRILSRLRRLADAMRKASTGADAQFVQVDGTEAHDPEAEAVVLEYVEALDGNRFSSDNEPAEDPEDDYLTSMLERTSDPEFANQIHELASLQEPYFSENRAAAKAAVAKNQGYEEGFVAGRVTAADAIAALPALWPFDRSQAAVWQQDAINAAKGPLL